jgi:hypothetical protein
MATVWTERGVWRIRYSDAAGQRRQETYATEAAARQRKAEVEESPGVFRVAGKGRWLSFQQLVDALLQSRGGSATPSERWLVETAVFNYMCAASAQYEQLVNDAKVPREYWHNIRVLFEALGKLGISRIEKNTTSDDLVKDWKRGVHK